MLKNLFALVFLALAVSPFTAPFQTCAEATAAVVAPLNNENDPGSLVSPLVTKAGRLTVAVAPPAGLGVSYFGSACVVHPVHPAHEPHSPRLDSTDCSSGLISPPSNTTIAPRSQGTGSTVGAAFDRGGTHAVVF